MSQKFEKSYWNFVQTKYKGRYTFADLFPILNQYMNRIRRHVRGHVKVLDVGCSFGYFLKLCDELDWEAFGMDISQYAINIAKENTRARLYVQDVQNIGRHGFEESGFDLVTMFEVIEHLNSPYVVLKEIRGILKYGGKLALTTPNLNAIERAVLKPVGREKIWHGFHDKTHENLFNPFSIRSLVIESGFRIIELTTPFNRVPVVVNAILERTFLGGRIWLLAEKT